jgi:hypothetical protein
MECCSLHSNRAETGLYKDSSCLPFPPPYAQLPAAVKRRGAPLHKRKTGEGAVAVVCPIVSNYTRTAGHRSRRVRQGRVMLCLGVCCWLCGCKPSAGTLNFASDCLSKAAAFWVRVTAAAVDAAERGACKVTKECWRALAKAGRGGWQSAPVLPDQLKQQRRANCHCAWIAGSR